jgi:3'(2'), 5'-bisphosphate nucleotidase
LPLFPGKIGRLLERMTGTISGQLIETAVRAALAGGAQILSVYNDPDFNVEIKGDGSPLTRADRLAHLAISEHLEQTGLPILSEEGKHIPHSERREWGRFWLVDPLDGTKEFIKRNDEFTVNIAMIENGTPILGVVYAPACKVLYVGALPNQAFVVRDCKATGNTWADLQAKSQALPDFQGKRPYRVVGSRSHGSPETDAFVEDLRKKHPDLEMVSMGSSFKLCLVAEGSADQYPRFAPTMEWDTAAAQAVVCAAGKEVLIYDAAGGILGPVRYNKENLLNPWFLVR